MKKLTTLLGVVALSTTFAVAGCKKKDEQVEPAAKTAEPAPVPAETPPTAPTPSAEIKPVEGQPAAAPVANELPAECADYKATIEKLATCEKVPAAERDQLKQTFDKDLPAWTAEGADKVKAASSCKTALDAIKTKHGKTCGW